MKQKQRALAILLSISGTLLLSGCSLTTVVHRIPNIPIPESPQIPAVEFEIIEDEEKICVDQEQARRLFERDKLLQEDGTMMRQLLKDINLRFGIDE